MDNQQLWYLENIDVGDIFCDTKMGHHTDSSSMKEFKKNDYVYFPDDNSDKIFFITKGSIKVGTMNDAGKEITKAILGRGEVFGELSIIGEDTRRDYAIAMEDTQVCILTTDQMKLMIKDHSKLSMFFMKLMGSKVLAMEKRLESLVFKDSKTRILEFIVDQVNTRGQQVGYEWVIRNQLTHQEIANICATSRQTVTTLLNELRNENIITFDRRRMLIRDLDKLKGEMNV